MLRVGVGLVGEEVAGRGSGATRAPKKENSRAVSDSHSCSFKDLMVVPGKSEKNLKSVP